MADFTTHYKALTLNMLVMFPHSQHLSQLTSWALPIPTHRDYGYQN